MTTDSSGTLTATALPSADGADLGRIIATEPLIRTGRNWTRWAGPVISLLILAAVIYQCRQLNLGDVLALVPWSIPFWVCFALSYSASPIAEWVIFHRLWSIPLNGFAALFRKRVSNEILLGYLGEVYFYAWARRNSQITTAPFGAIKDVAILSALVGNVVTLAMILISAPFLGSLFFGKEASAFGWSVAFIMATSLLVMLFRRRLFSLPRKELWVVTGIHFLRIAATTGLSAYMWHLVLPQVELIWWFLLSTVRQILGRLPFLPNKDVVFAGLAVFLIGRESEIPSLLAMMAGLSLAAHLAVGALLGASELIREGSKA